MQEVEKIQLPTILPRRYGIATFRYHTKFFHFPSEFARAYALLEKPSFLKALATHLKLGFEIGDYQLIFPEIEKYLAEENLAQLLQQGIKKRDESYNLWNASGSVTAGKDVDEHKKLVAVRDYTDDKYGNRVVGEAKSISDGRKGGAYRRVRINRPDGLRAGLVSDLFSTSTDESFGVIKGPGGYNIRIMDIYLAALATEYAKRSGRKPSEVLPFNFLDIDRAELLMEVLLAYYVAGMNLYPIDKRLLDVSESGIINKSLIETVRQGRGVVEVERQENREVEITDSETLDIYKEVKKLSDQIQKILVANQFRINGITVEFKNSEWENICLNYQKGKELYRILFDDSFLEGGERPPLLIVHRRLTPQFDFFREEEYTQLPEAMIGRKEMRNDDRTRRMTTMTVYSPTDPRFKRLKVSDRIRKKFYQHQPER